MFQAPIESRQHFSRGPPAFPRASWLGSQGPDAQGFAIAQPQDHPTIPPMQHASGFLRLVDEVRPSIKEITLDQAKARLAANPAAILLDVREDSEWLAGHAREARHLGRGVLERDIEALIPDSATEIIMYCGGGYRSALACDVAQKMGYTNTASLAGGYKAMVNAGWAMSQG